MKSKSSNKLVWDFRISSLANAERWSPANARCSDQASALHAITTLRALAVLQAELRVLQCQRTWALLFHVCHDDHIPAIMFWKWVWRNEIFISLTVPWQILCDTCDRFRAESQPRWKWLPPTAFDGGRRRRRRRGYVRIRAADHQNQGLFLFWTGHHHEGPQVNLISGFSHCTDN